jgi:hypothetical protein
MRGSTSGRAATTSLVAVAAFAAAVGVAWLLLPRDVASPAAAPGTPEASPQARLAKRATQMSPDAAVASSVTAPTGDDELPPAIGDGVIRGAVKSETGEPIAGVEVRAVPWPPRAWDDPPDDRDGDDLAADDAVPRFERERRWIDAARRATRTGADGRYQLDALADVKWKLRAEGDGFDIDPGGWRGREEKVGATVDFVARPAVEFPVEARLPDGTRAQRASVRFSRQGKNSRRDDREWRPDWTEARMPPGVYQVTGTAGDDDRYGLVPFTLDVRRGMPPATLAFVPRPGLIVTARRPPGFAQLAVWFCLIRTEGAEPSDLDLLRTRTTARAATTTPRSKCAAPFSTSRPGGGSSER